MTYQKQTRLASEHELAWALLPWYVNETLDERESTLVKSHVNECLDCRRELGALQTLRAALSQRDENVSCENALTQLHNRLDYQSTGRDFPWAAAASLALMIGLAVLTSGKVTDGLLDFAGGYETLGTRAANHDVSLSRTARIVFRQDVDPAELVSLLDNVDAAIADGPSARGAYTIKFAGTVSSLRQRQAIEQLRASGRVLFIEPVTLTLNERLYR